MVKTCTAAAKLYNKVIIEDRLEKVKGQNFGK